MGKERLRHSEPRHVDQVVGRKSRGMRLFYGRIHAPLRDGNLPSCSCMYGTQWQL